MLRHPMSSAVLILALISSQHVLRGPLTWLWPAKVQAPGVAHGSWHSMQGMMSLRMNRSDMTDKLWHGTRGSVIDPKAALSKEAQEPINACKLRSLRAWV